MWALSSNHNLTFENVNIPLIFVKKTRKKKKTTHSHVSLYFLTKYKGNLRFLKVKRKGNSKIVNLWEGNPKSTSLKKKPIWNFCCDLLRDKCSFNSYSLIKLSSWSLYLKNSSKIRYRFLHNCLIKHFSGKMQIIFLYNLKFK